MFPNHQRVHLGAQETIERLLRLAHHRFIFVERGIEHHWNIRETSEFLDQLVITRIGTSGNRLQSAGAVDMRDGWNETSLLLANLKHLHHKWDRVILFEPIWHSLFENEGAKVETTRVA